MQRQTSNIASIVFGFLGVVAFLASAPNVDALTISPARIEISGNPGQTVASQFTLINEQGSAQTFYSSAENFESQGESGAPSFVSGNTGLAGWISVAPTVPLVGGQEKVIPFSIAIPKDADPGGYFTAIFLSTNSPNAPAEGGQISVGAKIGVLVLLTVNGNVKESGGLLQFSSGNGQKFFSYLNVPLFYRFNNTGGDRVEPVGAIAIKNMFGMTSADFDANPQQGNILPNSTRRFDLSWLPASVAVGTPPPTGFWSTVGYEFSHFALGPYTAHLNITYGAGNIPASASYTVWLFPWQLLLVVLVILIILWLIFSRGIKRYNRYIISQAALMRNEK